MDINKEYSGLMSACMDFFGKTEGQKLPEFRDEVNALTADDKTEIKSSLVAVGYKIKD